MEAIDYEEIMDAMIEYEYGLTRDQHLNMS
jgi:hypothetical protein